ncbi:MAG: SAM-dependent methyltransferase [Planctomycetota bacterium]
MSESAEIPSSFVFVICQAGAEAAARKEILGLKNVPFAPLKLAFSRPGFLTFKVNPENPPPERFSLPSTLARTYGWSLGKVKGTDAGELVGEVCANEHVRQCRTLHVYQRETAVPGNAGFEPGVSPLAAEVAGLFETESERNGHVVSVNRVAPTDSLVADIVMVSPDEWWYGFHHAVTRQGRWPGGVPLFDTQSERTSRAYFKLKEALLWSGISIAPGDVCAEIGSAPGGACELLLELGAKVIAVDPAEMEPEIEQNSDVTWIRRRGHEVRKRDFSKVRWLMADLNIAPKYTLDTVRDIVNHESVNVAGMLLTLKVNDWDLIDEVPAYISLVKSWGFQVVRTRQLAFNRREFCLMAARDKFALRDARRKSRIKREGFSPKDESPANDSSVEGSPSSDSTDV